MTHQTPFTHPTQKSHWKARQARTAAQKQADNATNNASVKVNDPFTPKLPVHDQHTTR